MASRMLNFDNFMAEKKAEPVIVTVFGKEYKVKPEIPAIVPVMMARANEAMTDAEASRIVLKAADAMFGAKAIDEMCEKGLTTDQIGDLIKKTFAVINGQDVDGEDAEILSDEDGMVQTEGRSKK